MTEARIRRMLMEYFRESTNAFLPHISINLVVLGYVHGHLKVLAEKTPVEKKWMLPGGYVRRDENIDDAAYNIIQFSGITNVFLKQAGTFGDVHRLKGSPVLSSNGSPELEKIIRWISDRFISIVYYGLVNFQATKIMNGGLSQQSQWMDVNRNNNMAIDHKNLVDETIRLLHTELLNRPVALSLMPETFTLNEIRGLYEAILRRKIDRGSFRRKMLSQGIIQKSHRQQKGMGRPADVYRFNTENYEKSLTEEIKFGF